MKRDDDVDGPSKKKQKKPREKKSWPCKYYRRGTCKRGDNCTFSHDVVIEKSEEKKRGNLFKMVTF